MNKSEIRDEEATNNNPNNDLPIGWVWRKLDSCIEILDSQRIPINSEEREKRISNKSKAELYPYYGATGQVGWIDDYLFDEELVLLGEDGAPFLESRNKAYIIKGKSWVNNHAHILKAISEISLNSFLCHYLNIFDYHGYVSGSTRLKLNQGKMRQIPIPIPPIPEQRLIVTRVDWLLEHVMKAKESLEKIPLIMKRLRQAAFKKAFSGELTAEWRAQQQDLEPATELLKRIRKEQEGYYQTKVERQKQTMIPVNSENEPIDISDLPELPEGWLWTRIRDVNIFIGSGITPLGGKSNYPLTGIPFIRSQNVWPDGLKLDDIAYISEEQHETMSRTKVHPHDVLLNITGASIGRSTFVPEDFFEANVNQHVCIIRTSRNVDYRLISYFLNSPFGQDQIFTTQGGVTREGLNYKQVRSLKIPIATLEEQQEIVRRIESLFKFADETEKNAAEARKRVELMTQSILARAFRGDLSADFREAVKNWKELDAEARGRYIFVLPEEEREKVLNGDEFPMEAAGQLLERIGEERGKTGRQQKKY